MSELGELKPFSLGINYNVSFAGFRLEIEEDTPINPYSAELFLYKD